MRDMGEGRTGDQWEGPWGIRHIRPICEPTGNVNSYDRIIPGLLGENLTTYRFGIFPDVWKIVSIGMVILS